MNTPTNQAERIGDKVIVRDVVLWDLASFDRDKGRKLAAFAKEFPDSVAFATAVIDNTNADIDAGLLPQIVIEHPDVRSHTEPAVGRVSGRVRLGQHPQVGAAIVANIEYAANVFDRAVANNAYPRRSVELHTRTGKPKDVQISAVALLSGRLPGARVPDVYFAADDRSVVPTAEMRAEARRGLEWRRKYGRGGTEVGVARARDIAGGRRLSLETVSRMRSYFARHEVDKKGQGWKPGSDGYPSAGRIAWALWGGDAGKRFAESHSTNYASEGSSMDMADAIKTLIHGLGDADKRALFVALSDMVGDDDDVKPEPKADAKADKPATYAADPVLVARVAQSDAAVNALKAQLEATNAKLRRADLEKSLATLAAEGVEFVTDAELSYLCGVDDATAQTHIQRMRTNYRRSVAGSVIGAAPVLVAQFASEDDAVSKFKAASEKAAAIKGNK